MTDYVVSLWDFTGDVSLEQISFAENSLIRLQPEVPSPDGWAYGVCEVGGVKGYFPLNYTEPYSAEKHAHIPPPVPVMPSLPDLEVPYQEVVQPTFTEEPQPQVFDTYQENFAQPEVSSTTAPALPPLSNIPFHALPKPAPVGGHPPIKHHPTPPSAARGTAVPTPQPINLTPTPGPINTVNSPVSRPSYNISSTNPISTPLPTTHSTPNPGPSTFTYPTTPTTPKVGPSTFTNPATPTTNPTTPTTPKVSNPMNPNPMQTNPVTSPISKPAPTATYTNPSPVKPAPVNNTNPMASPKTGPASFTPSGGGVKPGPSSPAGNNNYTPTNNNSGVKPGPSSYNSNPTHPMSNPTNTNSPRVGPETRKPAGPTNPSTGAISARAAAPLRSKPRPVSTFIQNTPPPSQPLIRGRPAAGGGQGSSPHGGGFAGPGNDASHTNGYADSDGPQGAPGSAPTEQVITYCEALYDYTGDSSKNILSFPQGARIELKAKYDSGWWSGVLDGAVGYFPSNFVKELPPASKPMGGAGRFGGAATTDTVSNRRWQQQESENRRKSLGAPMSRSVMTKAIGGNALSMSQEMSYTDKRQTLATPLTAVPGVVGAPGTPTGGMGRGLSEEDGKKKKGIFSALKKKKNQKAATQN